MPEKKKAPRLIREVYSVAEWMPYPEARARVRELSGSKVVAERELGRHLRRDLPSAVMIVSQDTELFRRLKFSDWRQSDHRALMRSIAFGKTKTRDFDLPVFALGLSIAFGKTKVRDFGPLAFDYFLFNFYVSRGHFNRLYSAEAASADKKPSLPDQRNPPTPRASFSDWRLEVACECVRRAEAQETKPTAPAMIKFCRNKLGYQPNSSDMRKLLKKLYGL
jgi:hypothetical protein